MADIAAIGITNQRETTVVWDRATGKATHNAIVWQDRRTADLEIATPARPPNRKSTGLELDAYFSGTSAAYPRPRGRRQGARQRGELASALWTASSGT